jgi:hypothetical protein
MKYPLSNTILEAIVKAEFFLILYSAFSVKRILKVVGAETLYIKACAKLNEEILLA